MGSYGAITFLGYGVNESPSNLFFKDEPAKRTKAFKHNKPYNPNSNFDPKTGKKLWEVVKKRIPINGFKTDYDDADMFNYGENTFYDMEICDHSGDDHIGDDCVFIGHTIGSANDYDTTETVKSLTDITSKNIPEMKKRINEALINAGMKWNEANFGIWTIQYVGC